MTTDLAAVLLKIASERKLACPECWRALKNTKMSRLNRTELTESEISVNQYPFRRDAGRSRVVKYTNEKLFDSAFEAFSDFRRHQILYDITLEAYPSTEPCTGVPIEIKAHKVVLAGVSPYFKAMFTLPMAEADKDRVIMKDIDGRALSRIVEYMYSGKIDIDEENVENLLETAALLQIQCLKEACAEFLRGQLDAANCIGIHSFASMHNCRQLETTSKAFSRRFFSYVMEHEEMLILDINQFANLISDDKIVVKSEDVVFRAIKKWIAHSPADRDKYMAKLLRIVRLPQVDKGILLHEVREDPLVKDNVDCLNLILDSFKRDFTEDEIINNHWLTPRQSLINSQQIIIIGGQAPKASVDVNIFDPENSRWTSCTPIPITKCRCGAVAIDDKVYVVGGFTGTVRTKTVDIFHVAMDKWIPGPQMLTRRGTLGVASVDNRIYAVGGFDGNMGLCSAEVLDIREGRWSTIPSMATRRSSVGVCAHDGLIYAVAGFDGTVKRCLSTVECYDPRMCRWLQGPSLNEMRSGAGVALHQGYLICAGGHDGPDVRSSVEILRDGRWEFMAEMTSKRRNAGIVTANGKVFALGGDDGAGNIDSIEQLDWNETLDGIQWTSFPNSLPSARSYAGVAVLSPRT